MVYGIAAKYVWVLFLTLSAPGTNQNRAQRRRHQGDAISMSYPPLKFRGKIWLLSPLFRLQPFLP